MQNVSKTTKNNSQGVVFVIISCQSPEGLERHLDAARQKLPRDNFCRAITLTAGSILKEEKKPSLVGERQFGRHLKRQLG